MGKMTAEMAVMRFPATIQNHAKETRHRLNVQWTCSDVNLPLKFFAYLRVPSIIIVSCVLALFIYISFSGAMEWSNVPLEMMNLIAVVETNCSSVTATKSAFP